MPRAASFVSGRIELDAAGLEVAAELSRLETSNPM